MSLVEIFPLITMKKHLNFFKGASLMGLAVAALFGTCMTLTSCGGGGGDDITTPAQQAAEYMENKTLELHMAQACCYVNLNERLRGTSILDGTIKFGSGSTVQGSLIVTEAIVNGEEPQQMTIKISTDTSSISNETDFKTWWGVSSDNALVLAGETYIVMKNFTITPGMCTGDFTANTKTVTTDENGNEEETEQELIGSYFKLEQ